MNSSHNVQYRDPISLSKGCRRSSRLRACERSTGWRTTITKKVFKDRAQIGAFSFVGDVAESPIVDHTQSVA
jgi:hypothetical protein